ncbi:MAG: amidohydrolase [Pirellulaceae bacterium]|nr:amidohydrolase [Pirellulaceae bacterium]
MHILQRRQFHRRCLTSVAAIGGFCSVTERLQPVARVLAAAEDKPAGWIDAHVHVWTPDTIKYPLDKAFKLADMQPPSFTPAQLLAHCQPAGVDRIVLIQMSFYGLDHRYLFDCLREHPGRFSAVALIDHRAHDVADQARMLVQQGARGFRLHSLGDADHWPTSDSMRQLWGAAAEDGFAICPLINPQDIHVVDKLCSQFPDTTVVIDHFARIGVSGQVEQDRLSELCRLARFPKVHVKTSAFYALGHKQAPYRDLLPMIRRVLDAFAPERLMWATDCPYQVQGQHTYQASLDLILKEADFLSASDRRWLLRDTAFKVFFS